MIQFFKTQNQSIIAVHSAKSLSPENIDKLKSTFTNVTAELLTIVLKVAVDEDGDGIDDYTIYVRVPIFDDILANEYWEYDNDKLKLLQVRFYDVETDVSAGDGDLPAL